MGTGPGVGRTGRGLDRGGGRTVGVGRKGGQDRGARIVGILSNNFGRSFQSRGTQVPREVSDNPTSWVGDWCRRGTAGDGHNSPQVTLRLGGN